MDDTHHRVTESRYVSPSRAKRITTKYADSSRILGTATPVPPSNNADTCAGSSSSPKHRSSESLGRQVKTYLFDFTIDPVSYRERHINLSQMSDSDCKRVFLYAIRGLVYSDVFSSEAYGRFNKLITNMYFDSDALNINKIITLCTKLDYRYCRLVYTALTDHFTYENYETLLTRAIVTDRLDIFEMAFHSPPRSINIRNKTDMISSLISRAYYANKHDFCSVLIKGLTATELAIIRRQIPDLTDSIDSSNVSSRRTLQNDLNKARTFIDLQTAYVIHQSLGSDSIDDNSAYDVFCRALEFDNLRFLQELLKSHNIEHRLPDLYISLQISGDTYRLSNLLKLNIKSLQVTEIFDFKDSTALTPLQVASIDLTVLQHWIDRGHIDQNWALKLYRYYYDVISKSYSAKIVVLTVYVDVELENIIIRTEKRIGSTHLASITSQSMRNSMVLYRIIRAERCIDSHLVLYFINTREIDIGAYDRLLFRTAVQKGHSHILDMLSN